MPKARPMFAPTERALEFGRQYAEVLAVWGEFFAAGSKLVAANVRLGEVAQDASKEFEQWVNSTANAPWNWMNPDVMRRMMGGTGHDKP